MPQDGRFVRKQGLSRTGCLRTVSSYGNKAFPVPDAPRRSVRTKTRRFSYRMRDHQPVQLLHFRRKSRLRNQNDPPAILEGRFRRVGGAEMAPVLLDGQARTGIRRFPYRMPLAGRFVRKQGVSRTGCLRMAGSYENRAFLVPDASGRPVRTKTGRFPYRMRQDSQFVRKQGLSRTGCVRTVGSYGNKAGQRDHQGDVPYCITHYNTGVQTSTTTLYPHGTVSWLNLHDEILGKQYPGRLKLVLLPI